MSKTPSSSSSSNAAPAPPAITRQVSTTSAGGGTAEFNQFLSALTGYAPTFPESLTKYYMERAGFAVKDERVVKLVSLAADRVMSEIIYEAKQVANLKVQGARNAKRKADRAADSLEVEDLEACLSQYRIFVRKKKRKTDGSN